MNIEPIHVLGVGLGATFVMDAWSAFLTRTFKIPSPNYCLVGRWLCYMPEGIFRHNSITAASPKPGECTAGWIMHYGVGVAFAVLLVLLAPAQWLQEPTFLPPMIFGLATVAIPLFVMQPLYGLGVAASKTPKPTQARVRSLMNHVVFGFGLYISALAIGFIFKT